MWPSPAASVAQPVPPDTEVGASRAAVLPSPTPSSGPDRSAPGGCGARGRRCPAVRRRRLPSTTGSRSPGSRRCATTRWRPTSSSCCRPPGPVSGSGRSSAPRSPEVMVAEVSGPRVPVSRPRELRLRPGGSPLTCCQRRSGTAAGAARAVRAVRAVSRRFTTVPVRCERTVVAGRGTGHSLVRRRGAGRCSGPPRGRLRRRTTWLHAAPRRVGAPPRHPARVGPSLFPFRGRSPAPSSRPHVSGAHPRVGAGALSGTRPTDSCGRSTDLCGQSTWILEYGSMPRP